MNRTAANAMHGAMLYMLAVTAVVLSRDPLYADIPVPTAPESIEWMRMREMHWVANVSTEQIGEVRCALRSAYNPAVEEALINVVLYGLDELVPVISEGVGTRGSVAQDLGRICAEALKTGDDLVTQMRRVLGRELPGDEFLAMPNKPRHFRIVRHAITSVIVIHEVRAMRHGEKQKASLDGLDLSPFEAELVRLSESEATGAIDAILDELSKARVGSTREYTLIEVLHTYPHDRYLPRVVGKLEQTVGTEGYGRDLLLDSLKGRLDRLDTATKGRLRSVVDSIRRNDARPSAQILVTALEAELQTTP